MGCSVRDRRRTDRGTVGWVKEVVVFTGLPGTGKSTLAEGLASGTGVPAFAGDWLLGALRPHSVLDGLSRPEFLAMYYDLLETLIKRQLMLGQSAIVDCLIDDGIAQRWEKIAAAYEARLAVIECVCSDEYEHRRRLEGRRRGIPGWHEVGWDHVQRMRREYGRLTRQVLVVDAMDSAEQNLESVRDCLRRS
jgi:predicted kinase